MNENIGLAILRKPFPENQVSKLPKPTRQQTDEVKQDFKKGVRCEQCGGWHHPKVVHLDYVGHAALTDRLLDSDLEWQWDPLASDENGLPLFDKHGGLWIMLTVCGVSRRGYGHPDGKTGGDAVKETIGDALRNAAMRFGAALDLWHKGDLHGHNAPGQPDPTPDPTPISAGDREKLEGSIRNLNLDRERVKEFAARVYGKFRFAELSREEYLDLHGKLGAMAKRAKEEIEAPAGRFGAMKKALTEYLSANGLKADPEAIAEKGLSAAMGEFGDWPSAEDHQKFFATLQMAMDLETPCQCRACQSKGIIGVAKENGWKRESPPKPGFPVWACPDCQGGKPEAGS